MTSETDTTAVESARGHDLFVSYSRVDREVVVSLTDALAARDKRAWVDLENIPPSAEWMAEIRTAIEASDTYLVVISSDLARSRVCGEELELARAAGKRIVPILVRPTDPDGVPQPLAALNWIDATRGITDSVVDQIIQAVETDLDHVRAHTRLLVRAAEWERSKQERSLLLRGRQLADAEAILADVDSEPRPTQLQTRYVLESRKAQGRRQRGAIALVTTMLVLAALLGVVALIQRGQATSARDRAEQQTRIARSQALAAQALSMQHDQPDLAALLSLAAMQTAPTTQANEAVHVSAQTGAWVRAVFRGQKDAIFAVAFSPDGKVMASGSLDGTVAIWNVETGQMIGSPLGGHRIVQSVDFSPDGSLLASGGDHKVILWNVSTGKEVGAPLEFDRTTTVAFGPDGRTLAICAGRAVQLFDAFSHRPLGRPLTGTTASIWDMAFSPDGRALAASNADGSVHIWELRRPRSTPLSISLQSPVPALSFSPDGRTLAGINQQGVHFWDPRSGEELGKPIKARGGDVRLSFSPDGSVLATSSEIGGVRIWDARTHQPIAGELTGQQGSPHSLAFSPDGSVLAAGSTTGNVVLWGRTGPHRPSVYPDYDSVFSPDGSTLATGNADGTISLWDPQTDDPVAKRLVYRGSYVNQLAYSPRGHELAAGYGNGTAILWDTRTGNRIGKPITGQTGEVTIAFSPDGSMLASGSFDGRVLRIDPSSGRQVDEPLQGSRVQRIAFSPDGSMLAASGKLGKVNLWDPRTGEPAGAGVLKYGRTGDIWGLAFSPDGRTLATGFVDGNITLWDPQTGERIADLHGHPSRITRLRYSPDGSILASGSIDGHIAFRDARTLTVIGAPILAYGEPWGIDFSPDGQLVSWTGSNGSSYRVDSSAWTDDPAELAHRLCLVADRNMTQAEWARYVPDELPAPVCE